MSENVDTTIYRKFHKSTMAKLGHTDATMCIQEYLINKLLMGMEENLLISEFLQLLDGRLKRDTPKQQAKQPDHAECKCCSIF